MLHKKSAKFLSLFCLASGLSAQHRNSQSYLLDVTVPECRMEGLPFFSALGELHLRYGLNFAVEAAVEREFVEPLITLDLSNVTLSQLLDNVVEASGFDQAGWRQMSTIGARADLIYITLGDPQHEANPMNIVINRLSIRGEYNAGTLVAQLTSVVPELREMFVKGGVAGHRPSEPRDAIFLEIWDLSVRELLKQLMLKDRNLNWAFIYIKSDVSKSQWLPFRRKYHPKPFVVR